MGKYREIPVAEARRLAGEFDKSMVVILAFDPVHLRTHVTTFGVDSEDKLRAAEAGELCAKTILGEKAFEDRTVHADYRTLAQGDLVAALFFAGQACESAYHALSAARATPNGSADEMLASVAAKCKSATRLAADLLK